MLPVATVLLVKEALQLREDISERGNHHSAGKPQT